MAIKHSEHLRCPRLPPHASLVLMSHCSLRGGVRVEKDTGQSQGKAPGHKALRNMATIFCIRPYPMSLSILSYTTAVTSTQPLRNKENILLSPF